MYVYYVHWRCSRKLEGNFRSRGTAVINTCLSPYGYESECKSSGTAANLSAEPYIQPEIFFSVLFFLEVQMRLYFFQSSKCIIFIICVHMCTKHMCTYKFPFHLKEIFGKRDWPSKLWWFFWFDFLKTDAFLMHYILITFYIYVLYLPTSLLLSQSRIIPPLSLIRK